jgi:hypothetical protein
MLCNFFSVECCMAKEMIYHSENSLSAHCLDFQGEKSHSTSSENPHPHCCHLGHTSVTFKASYEVMPILFAFNKQFFFWDYKLNIKDVFLEGPFQPPRYFLFS